MFPEKLQVKFGKGSSVREGKNKYNFYELKCFFVTVTFVATQWPDSGILFQSSKHSLKDLGCATSLHFSCCPMLH